MKDIMITESGKYCILILTFSALWLSLHASTAIPSFIKFVRVIHREVKDAALRHRWGYPRW